uniref:G-protein coupled receptors family 3 profile domain-containing protein n=1 Tax=Biomphalaria glabrata TaxID=6526 RepID=A0A2C9KFI2_BIOGL
MSAAIAADVDVEMISAIRIAAWLAVLLLGRSPANSHSPAETAGTLLENVTSALKLGSENAKSFHDSVRSEHLDAKEEDARNENAAFKKPRSDEGLFVFETSERKQKENAKDVIKDLRPNSFEDQDETLSELRLKVIEGLRWKRSSQPQKLIIETREHRRKINNLRARKEGDAIIGAMFPLHRKPNENTRQCGDIWEHYGIHRLEAFIMTIEKINNDSSLLPNIKLGWDIRDSCWNSAIALENSIDFIQDYITSSTRKKDESPPGSALNGSNVNGTQPSHCSTSRHFKPIIGLIGPGSSDTTMQVQNLLQIFEIPQIGYSATVNSLSEKSQYQYFMRVVPPDKYQAQAMLEFIRYFKWTYILTVHTADSTYGYKGMDQFKTFAKEKGVCIAEDVSVANTDNNDAYDRALEKLLKFNNATVVVCFCEGATMNNLFRATKRNNVVGRFVFIGSDGWGNRPDVVDQLESAAAGSVSFMFYSPPLPDFDPHYASLTAHNPRNPWFREFWEFKFNCSLNTPDSEYYAKNCTGNESLAGTKQDSKLGFVANAVLTMAHALHSMHRDLCPGHTGLCPAMEPINGSLYWQYLLNVSFLGYNQEEIRFTAQGDPPGRYAIVNFQKVVKEDGNISYEYVPIGDWKNETLTINESRIQWPAYVNGTARDVIKSNCSYPCAEREVMKLNGHGQNCCWICATCQENEIMLDNKTKCAACRLGTRPDLNKTECEDIPVDFINWGKTEAITCMSLACLGICFTLWIFVIFLRYKDTPIVKASTRELSYIILVGICLAFSANFVIVAKPIREFCYLTRILPGLSFSLMYGALVTRTNRIARILEGSKRIMTKKPKFMSATAQVVITGIIIGIECTVITAMLVLQPADIKIDYLSLTKARLVCNTSDLGIVVPLGFVLVLIIFCTIYAVKTRNLPENFNEAKFIGFSMYSTCIIWLGFFPIYFAGENKEITLSLSMSLSAIIALLLLFVPKVYVIIWVPEKNTRGAFTTSRDVRCHIGSKSMASGDSIDIKESSTCDNLYKSDKGHNKNWKQKSLDEKRLRFVMQRSGGNNGDSGYTNHGVLPNLSSIARSSAFVNRDNSNDSTRTVSTPISSASLPDKERLAGKELRENPGVEAIRQSLARDFPIPGAGKRQLSLRPGSPAEKEKHRIHNVAVEDLSELLSNETLGSQTKPGKPRDFRKSLSSTCVSTCQKTKTAECQTGDELVQFMLPPLRKRCVSRNKLKRSGAVDDHAVPNSSPRYQKPHFGLSDPSSVQHPSRKSPLVICYTHDRQALSSLPDLDSPKSSSLLSSLNDGQLYRRRSHQHPLLNHEFDNCSERCCSNDNFPFQSASPRLVIPITRSHSNSRPMTPDSSDFSFLEGVEAFESSISPCYSERQHPPSNKLRRFPEPGISPSSRIGRGVSENNNVSEPSLLQDDSCSSVTASTASSSFTLPPFQTSTDSNHSNHSLGDIDSEEDVSSKRATPSSFYRDPNDEDEDFDDEDLANVHKTASMPLMGNNSRKTNGLDEISPVPSLEPLDQEENAVLEFQKYLQGHGVKLDVSTIQSSDL